MSQKKLHVKKDDKVLILAGKDKGKSGKVLKAMPAENRVIVESASREPCYC
ncbi:KOW motif-containing protein [Clostridium sp. 'deep sea']|uniref:KOW motif-containing protein n=1 Tax=Clostridium sp. 'deep sea' TaxID=2779445 RepID=UPI002434671A|nr:KOW motif-containing protein [Clostridium sp. 'deep sea']